MKAKPAADCARELTKGRTQGSRPGCQGPRRSPQLDRPTAAKRSRACGGTSPCSTKARSEGGTCVLTSHSCSRGSREGGVGGRGWRAGWAGSRRVPRFVLGHAHRPAGEHSPTSQPPPLACHGARSRHEPTRRAAPSPLPLARQPCCECSDASPKAAAAAHLQRGALHPLLLAQLAAERVVQRAVGGDAVARHRQRRLQQQLDLGFHRPAAGPAKERACAEVAAGGAASTRPPAAAAAIASASAVSGERQCMPSMLRRGPPGRREAAVRQQQAAAAAAPRSTHACAASGSRGAARPPPPGHRGAAVFEERVVVAARDECADRHRPHAGAQAVL